MATLKDFIESDMGTFLNLDEFSESHNVNGTPMNIIIDKDQYKERASRHHDPDGLYNVGVLFYVNRTEYGVKPAIGERLKLDSEWLFVSDVSQEGSMYVIELVARES